MCPRAIKRDSIGRVVFCRFGSIEVSRPRELPLFLCLGAGRKGEKRDELYGKREYSD